MNIINNKMFFFSCENCNYSTINKKDYKKHLQTKKHLSYEIMMSTNIMIERNYKCDCGREYLHRSSLNNHKKKCNNSPQEIVTTPNVDYEKMITTLIDENRELRKVLIEQSKTLKEAIPKIGNINTINSNNKFNINLFLNEQCKDAISMDNFIKSIEISLSNLLLSKDKGLAEGISNIFIENMNKLPITQRPLHCTDVKRETLYIKNQEKWEKDEKKEKTKNAIKRVSNLQACNINTYAKANPDYMKNDRKKDEYIDIVRAATSNIEEKEDKIIKNICKQIYINDKIAEKMDDVDV